MRGSRESLLIGTGLAVLLGSGLALAQDVPPQTAAATPAAESLPVARPANDFRVFWDSGLKFETADQAFKLKIGGRLQNDWAFFLNENNQVKAIVGKLDDGTEFRRARLQIGGTIYETMEFISEFDFAGAKVAYKDVYLGLKKLPYVGNFRVGHFKEPFGLDEMSSDNYTTFMERGLVSAFVPSRHTGVSLFDRVLQERMTWAVGAFRQSDDGGAGNGSWSVNYTGRLTFLPWYENKGEKLVHVGLAYSRRYPPAKQVQYRDRPEVHLAPYFVDSGKFSADDVDLIGLEAAFIHGPWSVQGELADNYVRRSGSRNVNFKAYYAQASYFLTGEHKNYNTSFAGFDRVKPAENFICGKGGVGAWEAAVRYSYLDLQDGGITGRRLADWTLGVNWHLNPNSRFMVNYVLAQLKPVDKYTNAVQFRFQVDF